jgi:hypothetical protein
VVGRAAGRGCRLAGGFRAEQIVAWVVVAVAAWVLWVRRPPANSVHESANA